MTQPPVRPRDPSLSWLQQYLAPTLTEAAPYKIDTPQVAIKLDQNESPWDLPRAVKEKVASRLLDMPWNRYPPAFADDLAAKLAAAIGVAPEAVLLGPGSNYLISLLLSTFGKGYTGQSKTGTKGKLVVARPSFPLYESHCKYEGIPYAVWPLNDDLEYDVKLLPELTPGSLVIFASPNNPVGNVLKRAALEDLLKKHPEVLFVADEAYYEYASEPYTELLGKYSNLLLLRTFSKTMGAAGVRIGYVVGSPVYLELLRKLRLPFLLNHFAVACAEVLLTDPEMRAHLAQIQRNAVQQRAVIHAELARFGRKGGFQAKETEANFVLLRWPTTEGAVAAYKKLIDAGILVRNVSGGPGLAGCLRVTLGDERENTALLDAFARIVGVPPAGKSAGAALTTSP